MITNTYGVPSYGEANPAVFSIVTFPYLFAIMFGDYGHGSIILFVGLVMVLFKKRIFFMNVENIGKKVLFLIMII